MRLMHTLGVGTLMISILRLLDIAWPTEPGPAWVYSIMGVVGFVLMVIAAPHKTEQGTT